MTEYYKEALNQLSKEQLIYLIEQLYHSQFLIGEVCVDESKTHITSDRAMDKIRDCLYDMLNMHNIANAKAYIDMKMDKISAYEYRKIIELED